MTRGSASADLAGRAAVQIWHSGKFRGSGFFVRARLVATCSHVLKDLPDDVVVRWEGQDFDARVVVRDPRGPDSLGRYQFPDIAFIGLAAGDTPAPYLDGQPLTPGHDVLVNGFSQITPSGQVEAQLRELKVTGESGGYVVLDGRQILPGMSGSPVIHDGRIRAMVKSGRLSHGEDGYALRASDVKKALRRHHRLLREYRESRPPLRRPRPGDTLHTLLTAQAQAGKRFPYQLAELTHRKPPLLSQVYVEQRTEARRRAVPAADSPGPVYEPDQLTPAQMLRKHRNALVVGDAGGGKSTLVHSLVAASADWWLGASDDHDEPPTGRTVPVVVAAVDLLGERTWSESLARGVKRNLGGLLDTPLAPETFRQAPAYGADWLFLVDGLDEIPQRIERAELVAILAHRIAEYGTAARFVITSRALYEGELDALRAGLSDLGERQRLGEYNLLPFDKEAVATFAGNWFSSADAQAPRGRPEDFLRSIEIGGLSQLVRVPLLATISAIVYEEGPQRPLPLDRAGLYAEFVSVLLTMRRSRLDARDVVRQQLRRLGSAAERFGEHVFDNREKCLRYLAAELVGRRRPMNASLLEWIDRQPIDRPSAVTAEHVREIIVGTGLVVPRGGDLEFLHSSFGEYLASLELVRDFRPRVWLAEVRDRGADSLGLFLFAAWVRAGNDPMPLVRELLGPQRQRRHPYLQDVSAMIEDGGILAGRGDEVVAAAWHALRRGVSGESPSPVLEHTLRAVYHRDRGANRLGELVMDRSASVVKRVEAARVLITEGSPADRERGVATLVHLAHGARLSDFDRLWALYYLAEFAGARERPHAVQRMAAMVETAQQVAVRSRALALLARADEVVAGAAALVRRAVDTRYGIEERISDLELLDTFLLVEERPAMPADAYSAGLELDDGLWRPAPRRPVGTSRQIQIYLRLVGSVVRVVAQHDPVTARQLTQRFVRDRALSWISRANVLRGLGWSGFPGIAEAGLLTMAYDLAESASNRVALVEMAHDEQPSIILRDWVYDPGQPAALRAAALDRLLYGQDRTVAGRFAEDAQLSASLRISAAARLAATGGDGTAEALAALRRIAAGDGLRRVDRAALVVAALSIRLSARIDRLTDRFRRDPAPDDATL